MNINAKIVRKLKSYEIFAAFLCQSICSYEKRKSMYLKDYEFNFTLVYIASVEKIFHIRLSSARPPPLF